MLRLFLLVGLFLFSLSTFAQAYKKLHQKAIVADSHNDVLTTATMEGLNIETDLSGKTHSDLARFCKGGVDVQVFSVFCDERYGTGTAFNYANREIDSMLAIISRNPEKLVLATNYDDVKKAVRQKKLACMMGVEGGHMIEDSIAYLKRLYDRGVRYLTLTWNNSTNWATSARFETLPAAEQQKLRNTALPNGLTAFGKDVVREMNRLGMLVDVSHIGEQTFWDVMQTTTKPVIASHSSVYAFNPHFRNLKDDQITAIGKNGGVIQVNFYSGFLDSNYARRKEAFLAAHAAERDSLKTLQKQGYEIDAWLTKTYPQEANALRPPLSLLVDHIDYIVKLIGVNGVGLGSDFDGIESAPKELDDVTTYPLVTKALLERGYSKKDVKKILGGNFLRVLKENNPQ
jgi:membrane dipeptidase